MEDILKVMVENLVENKDAITITKSEENGIVTLKINVDQADMGRVIGKQGRIAKSLRTIMKAVAAKENAKVNVDIAE